MSTVAPARTAPPPALADGPPAPPRRLRRPAVADELMRFLTVGGAGYVVDVVAFNGLRAVPPFTSWDPIVARVVAVAAAMVVTYLGNTLVTWRGRGGATPARLLGFVTLNLVALGFSVTCLWVSHDLLGWTSRWADNLSANVVGLALGTAFRFWAYRRFVFR